MSILSVNLKHLYQRRGMWLVHLFLGFFAFAVVADVADRPRAGQGEYVGLIVWAFIVGFIVPVMQIEALSKPFSYCLPGHRRIFRKYVFCIGLATNALCSALFITYPNLYGGQLPAVQCSAFFAGLTFYLAGVAAVLAHRNTGAVIGFLMMPLVVWNVFGPDILLERIIVEDVYPPIYAGILSSVAMWLWLGRADLARRHCNVPMISIFDCCNREKLQKYNVAKKLHGLKDHPRPWVERFFLGRMDKYDYLGAGRYVWGVLYNNFAVMVSQWKSVAVYLVLLTILSGYMIPMIAFALILLPMAILNHQRPPAYSSMLIFGGRRQRFVSTAVLGVVSIVLACAGVLIMSGLSTQLARFMPEIAVKDGAGRFVFCIIDARFVVIPLVVMPFGLTMQLVFYRKPVYMMLLFMLLFALMIPLGMGGRESIKAIITDRASVASIAVLGWLIFFLVLRYICDKRCLVGQGRSH
jgi:hypothetical protein